MLICTLWKPQRQRMIKKQSICILGEDSIMCTSQIMAYLCFLMGMTYKKGD